MMTFLDISDASASADLVLPLLQVLENMPLAVTLLATQAQYTSIPHLMERWNTNKTAILRTGGVGRLTSLDVSIEVSLGCERFVSNPDAMKLLQVLSVLPNGALLEDLSSMTPDDLDASTAILTLLQVSLAYRDHQDRLRVLSPIREYVSLRHRLPPTLFEPLISYHEGIAKLCDQQYRSNLRQSMRDRVTPQLENFHAILYLGLQEPESATRVAYAAADFSAYYYRYWRESILPLLGKALSYADGIGDVALKARLLFWLAIHTKMTSASIAKHANCSKRPGTKAG